MTDEQLKILSSLSDNAASSLNRLAEQMQLAAGGDEEIDFREELEEFLKSQIQGLQSNLELLDDLIDAGPLEFIDGPAIRFGLRRLEELAERINPGD